MQEQHAERRGDNKNCSCDEIACYPVRTGQREDVKSYDQDCNRERDTWVMKVICQQEVQKDGYPLGSVDRPEPAAVTFTLRVGFYSARHRLHTPDGNGDEGQHSKDQEQHNPTGQQAESEKAEEEP